jgi:pimeloyl-ACP methyl ester carboxylesterase
LSDALGPTSQFFYSHRLKLHYVDWGNESKPLLVLVHGTLDHCRNWDWVARALRDRYHIVAPDLRGHGDSGWSIGGEYSMLGYVTDLANLLHQINRFPVTLVGHSLGGGIVLQYAGIYPENVAKLVVMEGLGPATRRAARATAPPHEAIHQWITQVRELAARHPRHYKTMDEAVQRTREAHPRLSADHARHLTEHGLTRNEDGTYSWKYDNYIRSSRMAYPYREEDTVGIWSRITAPTLLVNGAESFAARGEQDDRASAFKHARTVTISRANHWLHHDQFDAFMRELTKFLEE